MEVHTKFPRQKPRGSLSARSGSKSKQAVNLCNVAPQQKSSRNYADVVNFQHLPGLNWETPTPSIKLKCLSTVFGFSTQIPLFGYIIQNISVMLLKFIQHQQDNVLAVILTISWLTSSVFQIMGTSFSNTDILFWKARDIRS